MARGRAGRWVALGVGLAVVASGAVYVPLALSGEPDAVVATVTAEAPLPGAPLEFDAPGKGSAAIGELGGGEPIWNSSDEDRARPMASITKLVTAFVVLEKHPLEPDEQGPSIPFTRADQAIYDNYWLQGVKILPFTAGTSHTERELLDIALIESAANYTDRLVLWAFGSRENYLTAARAWLTKHDLDDISVVDIPTRREIGRIKCGAGPRALALAPGVP